MAVAAEDLRVPNGPVTPAMFPGTPVNVLDANLTAYIGRAVEDRRILAEPDTAKTDSLIRALALHLAFQDAYIEMNAKPIMLNVSEKGGHGYSVEQIRNMRILADNWLNEFLALLTPRTGTAGRGGTKAIPNKYTF